MMIGHLEARGKLIGIIGLLLVIGFTTVNIANYRVSSQSVRAALINNELPLTSNNIYSEIQASLLRPIYISSLMANDTFLKDWVLDGEHELAKVTRYLDEIRQRYDVSSTFVVSARTLNYYYGDGILKRLSTHVPKDRWFFTMEEHPNSYRVEVDYNEAKQNMLTIFVNHKVYDHEGEFIGVTGLGLDVVSVAGMIEHYRNKFQRNIYFVDQEGMIKGHHDERLIDHSSIRTRSGISEVAEQIFAGDSGFLIYPHDDDNILLSYRFIPELNWYLLVEQPESDTLAPIREALYINLAIGAFVTLIVLLISGYTINRFQGRLEVMAKTDKLTGLINRQYFDAIFHHTLRRIERSKASLSLAIFDVNNLKTVNDSCGHLEGDRLLQKVAGIAQAQIRSSDVLSRWGGDEFTILFPDCEAEAAARIMEKIRCAVEEQIVLADIDIPAGISTGIAQYRLGDTMDTLLARADERLYAHKKSYRKQASTVKASAAQDEPFSLN